MKKNNIARNVKSIFIVMLAMLFISMITGVNADFPQPTSPDSMSNISQMSPIPTSGFAVNTTGGTITTYNINATSQNPHWKAYVGNISGNYGLQDSSGNSIYNWSIDSIEGEIYATRKSGLVNWNDITCANGTHLRTEETELSISVSAIDNIVNTFDNVTHPAFYAGLSSVESNTCNATNLYTGGQSTANFFEVLLYDNTSVIYTGLLEDSTIGFNGIEYDFQLLLPESGLEGDQDNEPYYFYVELT